MTLTLSAPNPPAQSYDEIELPIHQVIHCFGVHVIHCDTDLLATLDTLELFGKGRIEVMGLNVVAASKKAKEILEG